MRYKFLMTMKIRKNIQWATLLLVATFLTSQAIDAQTVKTSEISPKTGWQYNYLKQNAFKNLPTISPNNPPGMAGVTGGTIYVNEELESITENIQNGRKRISVNPFFMDIHEVSIRDWREYTNWLKVVYTKTAPEIVAKAMPREQAFFDDITFKDPFLRNYFSHPSFDNYPVVGISWEQAVDYCNWRTDRVNELVLIQSNIIPSPDFKAIEAAESYDTIANHLVFNTQKFLEEGNYLQNSNNSYSHLDVSPGMMLPNFRLPTEEEWEFAVYAINPELEEQKDKTYPWMIANVGALNEKQYQQILANYKKGSGYLLKGEKTARTSAGTLPVDAFYPNDFGIYNLVGNVNEWTSDLYIEKEKTNVIDSIDALDVFLPSYDNTSRIYKGGSWKDGIYWINPASRRYLGQHKSMGDLGFRCVMSMSTFYQRAIK